MKKTSIIFLLCTVLTVASANAQAFDGSRKGFQIELGIGANMSEHRYDDSVTANTEDDSPSSDKNFAASFSLGYGFSNRIVGFIGGNAGAMSVGNEDAGVAILGFGTRLYFADTAPSLYVTGLYGSGSVALDDEQSETADAGAAWQVGVGYEVTDRLHVELSHARADMVEVRDGVEDLSKKSTLEASFLTAKYVWY